MTLSRVSFEYLCYTNSMSEKDILILSTIEFDRFVQFLQFHPFPSIKYELNDFLYPLYVFVFLVGVWGKESVLASNFLSKYAEIFLTEDKGYRDAIEELATFVTLEDAQKNPYFNKFWESQFLINISERSWEFMKRFLKEEQCKVLAYFIWFHIAVVNTKNTGEEKLLKFTEKEFNFLQNGEHFEQSSEDIIDVTARDEIQKWRAEQEDSIQNSESVEKDSVDSDANPKEHSVPMNDDVFSMQNGGNMEDSSETFIMILESDANAMQLGLYIPSYDPTENWKTLNDSSKKDATRVQIEEIFIESSDDEINATSKEDSLPLMPERLHSARNRKNMEESFENETEATLEGKAIQETSTSSKEENSIKIEEIFIESSDEDTPVTDLPDGQSEARIMKSKRKNSLDQPKGGIYKSKRI